MSLETLAVGLVVGVATVYVMFRTVKDAKSDKDGGCGKGCGCDPVKPKGPNRRG